MTLSEQIESLIDQHTLLLVVETISEICGEKAEHIATNWQDAKLAREWATAEGAIGVASTRFHSGL